MIGSSRSKIGADVIANGVVYVGEHAVEVVTANLAFTCAWLSYQT